jgi:hypothetical protein
MPDVTGLQSVLAGAFSRPQADRQGRADPLRGLVLEEGVSAQPFCEIDLAVFVGVDLRPFVRRLAGRLAGR